VLNISIVTNIESATVDGAEDENIEQSIPENIAAPLSQE